MKLRAIEHRIGVIVIVRAMREVLKTDWYKKIQRLEERHRCFDLNTAFLSGAWSVPVAGARTGLPRRLFEEYRALADASGRATPAATSGLVAPR